MAVESQLLVLEDVESMDTDSAETKTDTFAKQDTGKCVVPLDHSNTFTSGSSSCSSNLWAQSTNNWRNWEKANSKQGG